MDPPDVDSSPERRRDDANMVLIEHRLTSLETKVDAGFQQLNDTVIATSSLFLRLDLYMSERDNQRADIEAAKKLAMWTLGLTISVFMGAIVIGIIRAAGLT